MDWSANRLGPVAAWPQSLLTSVSILLGSPEALQLFWGRDLILLYNDATRPMMGAKHPATFAQPALEHWPEVAEMLGGMLHGVLATGTAVAARNALIPVRRSGFLEETYYSWSYSPIRVESGGIGGVFQVASETTQEVLADRRRGVLHDLASVPMAAARSAEEACVSAAARLQPEDVPFALVYLLDGDARLARLAAVSGIEAGLAQSPSSLDLSAAPAAAWPFSEVLRKREPLLVADLEATFGPQVARGWSVPPHTAVVLPLVELPGTHPRGFLVAGLSAGLRVDASYLGFLQQIASQLASGLAQVRAREAAEENARMTAVLRRSDDIRRDDLRQLFDNAPVGMALMRGPDHVFELANEAHMALGGQRDIIGKSVREVFPEAAGLGFLERLDDVYRTGRAFTASEMPGKRFDTPEGPTQDGFYTFTYSPFRGSDGASDGVVAVVSDETETVRARQGLEELTGQLRQADRRKDEFLAMLGHELRNPLAPILTAIELMKLRNDKVHERERDVIERQVTHLTKLVGDLFDVSRIAQGKVELDRQVVELSVIADRAVEMASPLFEKIRQDVVVDIPRAGLLVFGDVGRLTQVISNLLTNASKFTPPCGHIEIRAAREGDEVVLRVQDDGTGIDPALLPSVFDLFVQSPRELNRADGGLGLGLALVRNLVTLHGGSVTARSDGVGRGAELIVRLPLALLPKRLLDVVARPKSVVGRRVMVVDDNEDAADLLADLLRLEGHEVRVAYDGAQALNLLGQFAMEVGVLDIGLPVMNGYDLARRIRGLPFTRPCRLIALTGYGEARDHALGVAAGFDAFYSKPVGVELLMSEIARGVAN